MKIPPNAKRVFRGVFFDVFQWEQEMFDGSKQTFERIRRPDTVQVLATRDGRVLLVEEEQPAARRRTGMIGGVVDPGETVQGAARRELLEEAGLSSDDWEVLFTDEPGGNRLDYSVHYFIARNCVRVADPKLEPGERITVHPLKFEEFVERASDAEFRSRPFREYLLRLQAESRIDELRSRLGFP